MKMATKVVMMLMATSFLMGYAVATAVPTLQLYMWEAKSCATTAPKAMHNGLKAPIPFKDDRSRIIYYESHETDEQGNFNMAVNKYVNGKELQPQSCLIRLVSSPHATCNILTNFAGELKGIKLPNRPTVLYRDLVQYQLGTFFYTTQRCAKPAADHNHDSSGCLASNNY
ncbi:putative Eukaryotic release factor 1 (eRF1) family protein [Hibiscus syriacus]|uniref:Eukaryotic release factor 1 (ERF1) family protein n=1 Tax=Hibiscus syriacus TaxID=106335 RepID=A0A6A2Z130_HIBSY|nr:putative Eukaryotic release factor 1 (eRF1) family protein [Hibiscus syriacus]